MPAIVALVSVAVLLAPGGDPLIAIFAAVYPVPAVEVWYPVIVIVIVAGAGPVG